MTNSITKELVAGVHSVRYELEHYLPAEFDISVSPGSNRSYHVTLHPYTADMLDLAQSEIPAEIYILIPASFSFFVKNTSETPLKFQCVLAFSAIDFDQDFEFESEWTRTRIEPGLSVSLPVSVTMPLEAIPPDRDYASYDVSVRLFASI